MKKRVVIHVGLPKCGSTSLQLRLAGSRDALEENGIWFPRLVTRAGETRLSTAGQGVPGQIAHMALANALVEASAPGELLGAPVVLSEIVDAFDASKASTLMLSSESFAMRAPMMRKKAIGKLFDRYDVDLLFFLRNHDTWLASIYKQAIKARGRLYRGSFDEFLNNPPPYQQGLLQFEVTRTAARLGEVMGARAIRIVDLEAGERDTRVVVGDALGVPLALWPDDTSQLGPRNAALITHGLPVNVSLGDAEALFLAMIDRGGFSGEAMIDLLIAIAVKGFGDAAPPVRIVSPERSRALLELNALDRMRLARRFGLVTFPRPVEPVAGISYRQTLTLVEWHAMMDRLMPHLKPDTQDALRAAAETATVIA